MKIVHCTPYGGRVTDIFDYLRVNLTVIPEERHTKEKNWGKCLGKYLHEMCEFWANCEFHTRWQYAANYSTHFQTLSIIVK